jgi:hypothetical protein
MEPEVSLPYSQVLATCPYPELYIGYKPLSTPPLLYRDLRGVMGKIFVLKTVGIMKGWRKLPMSLA